MDGRGAEGGETAEDGEESYVRLSLRSVKVSLGNRGRGRGRTAPVGAQTSMFSFVPYATGKTILCSRLRVLYAYEGG